MSNPSSRLPTIQEESLRSPFSDGLITGGRRTGQDQTRCTRLVLLINTKTDKQMDVKFNINSYLDIGLQSTWHKSVHVDYRYSFDIGGFDYVDKKKWKTKERELVSIDL